MKKLKKCIKSVISFSLAVVMLFSGISPLGIFAASASSFGVWQTDGNFTVTENGTYVIYAKDAVGNTTSIEITVNNIDYTPPTLDVGYSTTEWTKDGVKLVLTSVDQASPGGTAGTVSLSVVGSDGTSYPTDYLFTSNTSGTVTSTDDVGNAVSKPFSITNVDTTVPKISISADVTSPTNKDVTLKITGSDAESGLNSKPYSWDGKTWTDVATKAVSTNGSYTGFIRDAVGNISSAKISVANIDKVAPTISGYSYSTEAPCNTSVVVTVNATDTGLGLADSAYSFNGGAYGTSNKLTVTANGTYTVAVKDKAGNITNGSFKVSNLDFEAPVISSVVPSTTAETNKDVTLTINATDNVGGLGLADKAYRLQGYGDWQTSNVVTVTCNGTYTVEVKDKAGNVASKSIEITNIDKEPPTASHVLNITSPTNTDVVATLTILDNKGIKKVVTPDGTVVTQVSFQSITDYTFSKNGSYTFEIWDTADNKTTHTVDISNIDKDKPVIDSIERSTTKECNTYVDITVTAHDVGLGLEAKAFKFTGGDWQSANTLRVSKNGTYSVSVRDVAGNVTTQEFSVLNLDFDKPVIKAMTLSTTSQTNKDLTLTVTAEDVGLGLAKSAYRINGGTWQESNVFTITENGTYTIEVIDKAGNIQTGTKTVTNIDKVVPKLSATVNTTDPTNQDVVVTLKASDDVEISKVLDANGKSISLTKVSNEYTGTISESSNGTFTYKAVDTAGNETTCTVKIANIDKSNPVIDSIGRSTTVPVNTQVVITINAHDVGLGLADKPYNFDGTGWVSDKTKVITANGNYRISVKDVAGNITTQTYNVMNLDFDAPKVNGASLSTTSPTNKDVVLTIDAEDVGLGLADKPYRLKDGTWQASPEFTVSQNGTYSFEIIDKAGNIASVSKEVTNIDKVAPTISAKVNTTDPTNKDIEVTLTASDNVGIAKVVNTSGVALTGTSSGSNMVYVTKEPTNGTFTYTVTDTAGNTASVKVTIANVDKSAPVIDSIEKSTEVPVNTEVVVTVTAHDVGLGLSDTPYKLGEGSWVSNNKFTVTANGTYVISVLDKAGNTASKSFTISNLDFDAPVIKSVTQNTDAPTNKDITLTVTAEDIGLGLATKAYRIDGGEWQESNKFVVTKNGSYLIEVLDKAGNIGSYTKEVTNIDKVKPTITAVVNTEEPWNKDIVVTLTASDNVGIAKVVNTSGKVLEGTASNGKMVYTTSEAQNGTYTYTVTDTAGNTNSVTVVIKNIDKTAPVIDSIVKSTEDPINTKVGIEVTAHDIGLGLSDTPYRFNDGEWTATNTIDITSNGTYKVEVRDKAGNITVKNFDVTNLDFDAPVINKITQSTDLPTNKDITLTVDAEDIGFGLASKAYRMNGSAWQTSNVFTVSTNGDYLIEVLDKAGNIGKTTHTVTNIDKVKPTITASVSTDKPWNKDIEVTLTASDNVAVAKVVNTKGVELTGVKSGSSMVYVTSEASNGSYTYTVTDTAGNTASVTVKIANIDKDKPVIDSIVKSTEVPVNTSVGITVTAHDVGLGLTDKPFRFDGGEWSEIGETTITSNGTYVVEVMDKAGNIASKSYEVTNLDFDAPVVNKVAQSTDLPTNKDVVLTVDAEDIGLGLATKAYRMNGSEWRLSNKFTVSSNGDYTIEVLDMAGNIGSYVHKVTNIDKVAPKISVVSTNTNPTNQDVVLNVTATDNVGIAKVVNEAGDELPLVGGVFTYTVATNGTYKFTTYDTAGNTASASIKVENIDKQNPVVDKITKSTEVPVNTSVTVSVTAHDVGLGLDAKPYSWDGTSWTDANSTVIKSNGTYSVYVRDKSGNVVSKEFEITNLDFDAPVVDSVIQSTDAQTNKDITITVNAHDIGLGLASKAYRLGGGVWQSSNKFTISTNGSYLIEVLDEAGNIGSYTHTVSNIDKELPGITISVDKTEPVNTDVVLKITATDNVEVAKVVNEAGEELEGIGTASSKSYSYTVTGNGSYTFTVYDTAGNFKKGTFKVENIDKSNPVLDKISKSTEDPINTNVVVTVTAHDVGLGLADKPYKFDNGDWTDVASTTITSNGTYTVQIKDKAGNVITESYEVSNLDFIAPVISSARVLQTRPVKESARIAVQATDEGFGLADKAYKLNDGDWQTANWFDVTDNGTYTVYVRDKAGNITSTTVEVTNIDKVKPELTYTVSTTEPTNTLYVYLVATDNMELGSVTSKENLVLINKNWVSKTEYRCTYAIKTNGTFRFDVRDFVGNTNYIEVTANNLDTVAPTIDKIIKNPDVPTNAPLEITIIASDVGFGLADEPYRVDGSAWQSSNKFMIADNGVHRIDVRDKAGNTLMMTTDISNLDYDNPVIDEVTQDITEQTNTDVVLTVTAHDVGLGLAKRPYKLGEGIWKSTNKFTVEENGDYVISVRDEAGNIETYTHTVSNIDKELPVASHTVDIDTPTSSDVVITFKATDNVEIKSITLPDKVVQDIGSNEATIPFTVVENGTYTFKVLDTAGNITTYPVEIDNIDKNPAEIVASPSVEGWTNQDIELNVVVTDDTLVRKIQSQGIWYDLDADKLPDGAVVEKGGQDRTLKVKFSVPVSDNGTFEFKAIDFGGLETTYSYEVTTIDRVDPEIFAKVVNTDPTKDNVDIAITTSDAYGEVSQIVLPGDNRIDGVETTYIATDNGDYKFIVVDKAGNSAEAVVKVGNIDRVAPTFTYELSPNEDGWSNDSVLLKVIGSDENGISAYKLFFGEEEIKALEGGVFQLFENGTYRIVVVDTVGNYSGTEIIVGNIDKDEPTIAVGLKNKYWVNKSNTIVITGQDNSSGVSGYSLDGVNWQESNEFKVSYKNSYTVYVKDIAGNVSSMTVYFDLVEEPIEDVEPLPEEEPKDDEDEDIVAPKSDLEDGSLIVIGELTDLPIEATEAEATESDVLKVVQKIAENVAEVAKVVFPYAVVLLLATVGGLVFILLTDGVRVYGRNKKGKWQYLGIARCHKGVIGCTVKVNRSVLKKVDSADYLLKFNTRYSTINKGLELYIKVGNQAITSNVYKQVEFSVMK